SRASSTLRDAARALVTTRPHAAGWADQSAGSVPMHRYSRFALLLICLAIAPLAHAQRAAPVATGFTLEQVLDYPYPSGLVAAEDGERIAWVVNSRGVRNVWVADGPGFEARQVTAFDADDGREITGLAFS